MYGVCGTACRLDKHTIFVGNLPESINEEDLFVKFTRYGHILDIHLIRKPVYRHTFKKVFAFVKYQGERETAEAIDAEVGLYWYMCVEHTDRLCTYRTVPCTRTRSFGFVIVNIHATTIAIAAGAISKPQHQDSTKWGIYLLLIMLACR